MPMMDSAPVPAFPVPAELVARLRAASSVVVFTGAGVSVESGIATFRDGNTGLWQRFSAHDLATPQAFEAHPATVWGWYEWRRAAIARARPNPAHMAIAALTPLVKALHVVTQNVDDLHERAGSQNVLHLHGRLDQARCHRCGHPYRHRVEAPDEPEDGRAIEPPRCDRCQGQVRPGVVWFGESLPADAWLGANQLAENCDVLLSVGTSALVYPAAALPEEAARRGATVVQVNPAPTMLDQSAHFNLRGAAGAVMSAVLAALESAASVRSDDSKPG